MEAATDGAEDDLKVIWDGRHLAFQSEGRNAVCALVSHTNSEQELTAVWEAAAGACVAQIPEGCRHLEIHRLIGGLPSEVVAIELDDQLLPELLATSLPALRAVACSVVDGQLALGCGTPDGAMRCLNLPGFATAVGGTAFSRLRVGPLHDAAGPGRRILVRSEMGQNGARLRAVAGPEAQPIAAHVFGPTHGASLQGEDASGASPEICRERGFRLAMFEPGADGALRLDLPGFVAGDEALVLAPRGHVVAWSEEPERSGARLFLSLDASGRWSGRVVAAAYRPATSTAMAALGSGGALAIYEGGATATPSGADWAADLAAAIWRRRKASAPEIGWLAATPVPAATLPLARLTKRAADAPSGLSPIIAALGDAYGASPAAIEEIDALPLEQKLALVLWFAEDAALATQALRRRVLLPQPGGAPPREKILSLLSWCEDPHLRQRLEAAAGRMPARGDGDEDKQRILRHAAGLLDEGWIALDDLAAAETVLRQVTAGDGEPEDTALRRLLSRLRSDREVLAAAQAASRGLDLAQVAEWRSGLVAAAVEGGQPSGLTQELGVRLADLATVDIILLHRHFRAMARRIKAMASIREAVAAMDTAAGNGGLAARMDRDGDALVGMTRLGSASEAAVRALTKVPPARDALVALTGFVDRHVEPEPTDPLVRDLRRNLQSYGCLLLAQAITRECADAIEKTTAGEADRAWRERLRSGVVEMLPTYARVASDVLPDEAALGRSFTDRLPGGR